MSNKRYPDEFKVEAVKQVTERGHGVADVTKRLGFPGTARIDGSSNSAFRRPSGPRLAASRTRYGGGSRSSST